MKFLLNFVTRKLRMRLFVVNIICFFFAHLIGVTEMILLDFFK